MPVELPAAEFGVERLEEVTGLVADRHDEAVAGRDEDAVEGRVEWGVRGRPSVSEACKEWHTKDTSHAQPKCRFGVLLSVKSALSPPFLQCFGPLIRV